jgi:hypothetical protein
MGTLHLIIMDSVVVVVVQAAGQVAAAQAHPAQQQTKKL